MPSLIN